MAAVVGLISAATLSNASAQELTCHFVRAQGASFLEECGKRLNSFSLSLSEIKLGLSEINREVVRDLHGRFSFPCPVEPMCENEPYIDGFFVAPETWNKSSKDEGAIYQALQLMPFMAISFGRPGHPPSEVPAAACPPFDVSVDGMAGRAVCFDETQMKGSKVVLVAADDRIGFVLTFYLRDQSANALRDKVLELIPRFKIERATGDVALLKWMK